MNLESSIVDISGRSCSTDEDRICVCGSIQTLQDSAGQTLTVDLQCSCAFSKSVNCTQTECSLLETPPTTGSIKASERSSMLVPTTTTNIMTTPSMEIATHSKGKTSEMVSSSPTIREGNNMSEMQGCNNNSDTF